MGTAHRREEFPHSQAPVVLASILSASSVRLHQAAPGLWLEVSLLEQNSWVVGVMSSIRALVMFFKAHRGIYIHTSEPHIASKFSHLEYSQVLRRNRKHLRGQKSFLRIHALNFKLILAGFVFLT